MITQDNEREENEIDGKDQSSEYRGSSSVGHENNQSKINVMDREMGSLRSNFVRTKMYFKNINILDREIGSVNSIFFKIKMFFVNVYRYIRNFFTKKKLNEIRTVFRFKRFDHGANSSRDEDIRKYKNGLASGHNGR